MLQTAGEPVEQADRYWFARHSTSIIFLIGILTVIGVYEALTLPVAVFPTTNFPRIIIGVDNGVTPIEQMEVSITRPLEEAVRTVPGLEDVRSVTSRGSAEINLFFDWTVNMLETLQLVDAAVSRVQRSLPATAQIQTHRLDFSSFPIIGYSLTSDAVPQTELWELATYDIKPRLNRLPGVASVIVQGGQRPEFHAIVDPAQMLRARTSIADIVAAVNRSNVVDSPGLLSRNHQLFLGLIDGQVHSVEDIGNIVVKRANNVPVRVRDVATVAPAVNPRCCSASTVSRTATPCRSPTKSTRRWPRSGRRCRPASRCGPSTINRTSSSSRSPASATRS
jgi:multidrug efflux pump subunit AcrB